MYLFCLHYCLSSSKNVYIVISIFSKMSSSFRLSCKVFSLSEYTYGINKVNKFSPKPINFDEFQADSGHVTIPLINSLLAAPSFNTKFPSGRWWLAITQVHVLFCQLLINRLYRPLPPPPLTSMFFIIFL